MDRRLDSTDSVLLLENAIRSLRPRRDTAFEIFDTWPSLYRVALRYTRFVTPHIDFEGQNLLAKGIGEAVAAYLSHPNGPPPAQARAFLRAIADQASILCRTRMSVRTAEGHWAVWRYDQPLQDLMLFHGRASVQVKERERLLPLGPVLVKFLSYICTVRDLELSGIQLNEVVVDV
ncbi:MAG: hypothetical protein D4R84_02565 [Rhodocyclaceae bacterium]|nr:MAG: hypothetical protein D4R84_02565 [Rhodocyclaceae bacterium]